MSITRMHSGPKLSRMVIHNETVYLCGQVDPNYSADRGIRDQTQAMLERIDGHLEEAGTDRNHILMATIYIKDITQAAQMNEVWGEWLGDGPRPARSCVQAEMAKPEILVEMAIIAAKKA